ncbi:single-stranded DNA-binding protein [Intestinibacter bartlettii]|uniref:single-stranded DNA-binding protein n=1 Tax=Intestinibacter bartlettii TaxID=261299 RepID=UPI0035201FF0
MNLVTLIGRLTADPELKFFSSGTAISKGTIAIDRSYKKDNQTVTDFIPVEVWGKQAEYFATCFQKGYLIAVSGSLHIDRYVDFDGNNRNFAKIVVHKLMRLNIPKGNGLDTGNGADASGVDNSNAATNNTSTTNDPQANLTACIDDEEIPF